jgi:hypothetical protein
MRKKQPLIGNFMNAKTANCVKMVHNGAVLAPIDGLRVGAGYEVRPTAHCGGLSVISASMINNHNDGPLL